MCTVIVLGTTHSEGGACTSEELYKIIHKINPQVVFCESSPEKLPQYIKRTDVVTPEMEVIRKLIKEKSTEIIPVDLNEDPFDKRLEDMFSLIKREMKVYYNAHSVLLNETYLKGFTFLNSLDGDKIFKDMDDMEKYFIDKVKHKELTDFYFDWLKWNDMRENQWISLIDKYFKLNKSKKAVFLVGAGHRHRLMDKIKNIEDGNKIFFDWNFFYFQ
ncbi:MAG: hypothetical protein ACSHXF_10270 [Aquaticitalea sp.]